MREKQYDIVIVGSGAGGGTAARELAPLCRHGIRIALLEAGPKLDSHEYTGRELEMAGKLYYDGGGVFTRDRSVTLACGRAYGGSTVVFTGTSLAMPETVLRKWQVPELEWEDLNRRSAKYLGECNAHLLPGDLINENNRLFVEGCRKLGYRCRQFPVSVLGCRGSGLCNLGCPNSAKQGTHKVQLPEAERMGVEVVTNCRVESIREKACRVRVQNRDFGQPSSWEPGEHLVKAGTVIVCAGALHSPALLLHSGFGKALPALGRYLTLHPALILAAEHPRPLTNFHGHPKSFYSDHFHQSHGFLLEACMYFPFTTAKNLIGFGAEHSRFMEAFPRLQMILVLALDEALPHNRVRAAGDGSPVVDYRFTRTVLDSLHESMKASARVFFAAGARRVHAPAGRAFLIEAADRDRLDDLIPRENVLPGRISITSAHIMGGCRMGTDAASSVTNPWGRVHGFPWLYVADSSLFPRCSEVNPYITVMALADRVAERVRMDLSTRMGIA